MDNICATCGKLKPAAVLNATGVPLCFCIDLPERIIYGDVEPICGNCHWWQDGMCMNIDSEWCGINTVNTDTCDEFKGKNDKDILSDLSRGDLGFGGEDSA